MKKLLISGGSGKLARHIIERNVEYEILAPSSQEMDITVYHSVESYISKHTPDIFLHAAAYTRPMKKHQNHPDISVLTNIVGTSNVVLCCMKHGVKLVYISTDYVYPGVDGNYGEDAPLSPYVGNNDGITKYGWSKLGGECAVRIHDNSLILRVCMCNSPFPHDKALVDTYKSLIFDHRAAELVLRLLGETGVINVGGAPQSVYDFASRSNSRVGKITRGEISDVKIAPDTTMNIAKLKRVLSEHE